MQNPVGSKTVVSSNPYIILNNQGEILPSMNFTRSYHKLGRDPQQVDLAVPAAWTVVSRTQACFRRQGNDYYIYDGDGTNPSSNKLFINNTIITPKEGYRLENGDEVKIGQNPQNWVTITFYDSNSLQTAKPLTQPSISLKDRSVLLGREGNATLQLDAPTVSRRHATIDTDDRGRYILQDYSTNGVFVNGQKVSGSAVLASGDTIRIGPYTLILKGEALILADQGNNIRLDAEEIVRVVRDKKKQAITILNHISLPIEPGQFVALVGGSGTGKSTLLKTLLGIEPTTSGHVYLNGEDLRKNFNIYRNQIGYVPQHDIVHKDLTVREVLYYAAKLRLPPDIDIEQVIQKTLNQVELLERENTLVKDLSGGQLKRVSIAVELLADPKLFFLDEPTSGLDPGLDKKMMELLDKLASEGRTIVLVTHATNNIKLCDNIVFLGKGGNVCYFGSPQEATQFFSLNKDDFADIYIHLEGQETVLQEAERFRQSGYYKKNIQQRLGQAIQTNQLPPQKAKQSFWQQFRVLAQRYFKLIYRDPIALGFYLLTAPIGIILMALVLTNKDPLFFNENIADSLAIAKEGAKTAPLALRVLFVFTCASLWVGLSSSLQEIIKESEIYLRERLVNLGLLAYLLSKVAVLGSLAFIQSILITIIILIAFKNPIPNLFPWFLGVFITTFLTIFASISLGLMISSKAKNITQANSLLPFLLIPQIIFAGVLFTLKEGLGQWFSWLMISRWSIGAYGIFVEIDNMLDKAQDSNLPVPFDDPAQTIKIYSQSWGNLSINWGMLLLHSLVYLSVAYWLQKRKDIL